MKGGWLVKCLAWISAHSQEAGVGDGQRRLMHSGPRWAGQGHAGHKQVEEMVPPMGEGSGK